MFKHFAMKNAPIGFWVLVIWGGFIQDSAAQNPSLTEESFSQLSIQERELFLECKEKAESLAITYANIEAKFKVSEVVHENDSAPSESKFDVTVFNCGGKFRADEMKIIDDTAKKRIRLCDETSNWILIQDGKSAEYFLSEHSQCTVDCWWDYWWFRAPYSFQFNPLSGYLFSNSPYSRLKSVKGFTDESGERMIEILRDQLPSVELQPGDKIHDTPTQRFTFFRDRSCALHQVETIGFIVGTQFQLRKIQTVEYSPFVPDQMPVLRHLSLERAKRTISQKDDETAWETFSELRCQVTEISLAAPELALFEISNIIDYDVRLRSPRAVDGKWYFAIAGCVFLALWYLLHRRNRDLQKSNVRVDRQ